MGRDGMQECGIVMRGGYRTAMMHSIKTHESHENMSKMGECWEWLASAA